MSVPHWLQEIHFDLAAQTWLMVISIALQFITLGVLIMIGRMWE